MATDTDPTAEFLRSLDDPAKFHRVDNVPIWVPHERANSDGTVTRVTEDDLPAYAAFINQVEQERGVAGRVTDGHIMKVVDGRPVMVSPPPKLMGYYKGARVGTFGKDETPAVLTTIYYHNRPDVLATARERPYRSPEVFTKVKQIRGVALLLNDPFLDMGVVTPYDRGTLPTCYGSQHMPGEMGPTNAAPAEDTTKPEEKELFEKMRSYMCRTYGLGEEWPGAAKPKADPNAAPGKPGDQPPGKPADKKDEVTPMERGEIPAQYAAQIGELRATLAGLQLERDQERCQMLLYGLEHDGFQLTDAEKQKELAKLVKLPQADRDERAKELRAIYATRQVPQAQGRMQLYGGLVEGGTPSEGDPFGTPWYHEQATAYMMANPGMPYERAVAHVKATKQG